MAITSLSTTPLRSEFYGYYNEMIFQTQFQSDSTISVNTTATGTIIAKNLTINNGVTLTVYDKLGMIICDTLTLNGTISANGLGGTGGENAGVGLGSSYGYGGNGGGSVIIIAKKILGSGTISANGTNGTRLANTSAYGAGTAPTAGKFKKLVGSTLVQSAYNIAGPAQPKILISDGTTALNSGYFITSLDLGDNIYSGGGGGSNGGNSTTATGDGGGGGASLFFDGGIGGDCTTAPTSGGLGGGGGGGGGFVFIATISSVPSITISANGGNGASTSAVTGNTSGGGGGGAGGVVGILAPSSTATVTVTGGTGGTGNNGLTTGSFNGANGTTGLNFFKPVNLA